jgi:hypothetical protein
VNFKKIVKVLVRIISYVIVGLTFVFVFNGIWSRNNNAFKSSNDDLGYTAIIDALESYYGKWEIVEDFGYHGIHRTIEIDMFEIGETLTLNDKTFYYEGAISVEYPHIELEITNTARMQQFDNMWYPVDMGFDDIRADYIKVKISGNGHAYNFYILNKDEIIIEGDVRRYYRAVRKSD